MDLVEKAAQRLAELKNAGIDARFLRPVTPPARGGAAAIPTPGAFGAGAGTGTVSRCSRCGQHAASSRNTGGSSRPPPSPGSRRRWTA